MNTIKALVLVFLFFTVSLTSVYADDLQDQAFLTVEDFVSDIDSGNLAAAYFSASPLMRLSVRFDQWVDHTSELQQKLGQTLTRELKAVRSVSTYPGMPDGQYLLVYFQNHTEYKAKAHEIVLVKLVNGIWKVCSYYLS